MMRLLQKVRFNVSTEPLRWRQYLGNVEFLIDDPQNEGSIIYLIDDNVTFPELRQREIFKEFEFKLPKQIDEGTPVASFLTTQQKPYEIQVTYQGQIFPLKNRIASFDQRVIIKSLTAPNSIYHLTNEQLSMNENRKIVSGFYLRLQIEAFLGEKKEKGFDAKSKLKPELVEQIFAYLGSINQTPEQSNIFKLTDKREKIVMRMAFTQSLIDNMLQEADGLLNVYKAGVIGLTAIHLGGFGYAIFGIQWLGWDIIEPLTFSVGTIYTLLGLRFYRRFKKDRTQETIREALRDWVLKPSKRIQLSNLRAKLQQEKAELRDVEEKQKLAKHRLVTLSTLPDDM